MASLIDTVDVDVVLPEDTPPVVVSSSATAVTSLPISSDWKRRLDTIPRRGNSVALMWMSLVNVALTAIVTVLAVITIVVPRMYVVEGLDVISIPISAINASTVGTSMASNLIPLLPDFIADVGIVNVCFGPTCSSRRDRILTPLTSYAQRYIQATSALSLELNTTLTAALLQLVMGGPLDFSVYRGEEACSKSRSTSAAQQGVIVAALCVAAVSAVVACGYCGSLVNRLHQVRCDFVAIHAAQRSHQWLSTEFIKKLGSVQQNERRLFIVAFLFSIFSLGGMVVAAAVFFNWEESVNRCSSSGFSVCKSITDDLKLFWQSLPANRSISNGQRGTPVFTCGAGAAQVAMWVALAAAAAVAICSLLMIIVHTLGPRIKYINEVRRAVFDLHREVAAHGALVRVAGSSRRPRQKLRRSSERHASEVVHQERNTTPARHPPSPPPTVVGSSSKRLHSRKDKSAKELTTLMDNEAQVRRELVVQSYTERIANFRYPKQKMWRNEHIASVHSWSLEWIAAPLLDLHVEETYYRQELLRKWYAKLLDHTIAFPPVPLYSVTVDETAADSAVVPPVTVDAVNDAGIVAPESDSRGGILPPMVHRLPSIDEVLRWASWRWDEPPADVGLEDACEGLGDAAWEIVAGWLELRQLGGDGSTLADAASLCARDRDSVVVSSETESDDDAVSDPSEPSPAKPQRSPVPIRRATDVSAVTRALLDNRALYTALAKSFPWNQSAGKQSSPPRVHNGGSSNQHNSSTGGGSSLDFKLLQRENEALRQRYEDLVRKGSSRLHFDRGLNASSDAAKDYHHSTLARVKYAMPAVQLRSNPATMTNRFAAAAASPWATGGSAVPDASWGEGAVADRLSHLGVLTAPSLPPTAEDDEDLR